MTKRYEFLKQDEFTNTKVGHKLIPETWQGNYLYDQAVWIPETGRVYQWKQIIDQFPKKDGATICMTKWLPSETEFWWAFLFRSLFWKAFPLETEFWRALSFWKTFFTVRRRLVLILLSTITLDGIYKPISEDTPLSFRMAYLTPFKQYYQPIVSLRAPSSANFWALMCSILFHLQTMKGRRANLTLQF